ncbi:hypothetical protein ACWGA9_24865 [Streptomyces sp. NPDC054950]
MANPNPNPPVIASAAAHAARIRGREERAEDRVPEAGLSTAERIAQRILPGYRADEELREQARLSELRARGVIAAADDEPDEEYDVVVDEEVDEAPEVEAPKTTAEIYAERERARQQAERAATLAAHRSAGQVAPPQIRHNHAEALTQPYKRGQRWGSGPAA